MIILMDGNVWEKLAYSFERGISRSGTVILEKHLIDDGMLHWVCDLGGMDGEGRRLLGRVELNSIIPTDISDIKQKYAKAAGFESKEFLKRTFAACIGRPAREIGPITVAEMKIFEVERYWCTNPECLSVNLNFLNKNIFKDQLPFACLNCGTEFYTPDKDFGSPRIKNAKLGSRYRQEEIKKIPADQQKVLAIAGEQWLTV